MRWTWRDRTLMQRRMRQDQTKHGMRWTFKRWINGEPVVRCKCSPGRFRKRSPYGCPRARCGMCQAHKIQGIPNAQELRAQGMERALSRLERVRERARRRREVLLLLEAARRATWDAKHGPMYLRAGRFNPEPPA